MSLIFDVIKRDSHRLIVFPDRQPHVILNEEFQTADFSSRKVTVVCSIISPDVLLELGMCINALRNCSFEVEKLVIPYLLGARSDRHMNPRDSFDLKVIAGIINSFEVPVHVYHPHNAEACKALFHNFTFESIDQRLIDAYDKTDAVLISPDKGSRELISRVFFDNTKFTDLVKCEKSRDSQGNITLRVLNPEVCSQRDCVIVDDLCDGGGTFLIIASQIKPRSLTLIVSHGIFSKGMGVFENSPFTQVICSNSFPHNQQSPLLTTVALF